MLARFAQRTLLLLACAFEWACSLGEPPVVISEFLAANASGLKDIDGDTSDWIELHNRGRSSVDLEGWCMTDKPGEMKWCFPTVSIPPQSFLLVFASGKHPSAADAQLHATFKLSATGDYLALAYPNGRIASEFNPYPEQKVDVSYGLLGTGKHGYLRKPTPGAPNSAKR